MPEQTLISNECHRPHKIAFDGGSDMRGRPLSRPKRWVTGKRIVLYGLNALGKQRG